MSTARGRCKDEKDYWCAEEDALEKIYGGFLYNQ
jgi:hypothetical protein